MRFRVRFFIFSSQSSSRETNTCTQSRIERKEKNEGFVAKTKTIIVITCVVAVVVGCDHFLPWTSILTQLVWKNHTKWKREKKVLVSDEREKLVLDYHLEL